MKCPYCEKEMTLGYIQCRDGVYWTLKKQLVASLSSWGKGSTCLSNGAADNSNTVFAFKCEACKKIIIDYSRERYALDRSPIRHNPELLGCAAAADRVLGGGALGGQAGRRGAAIRPMPL